MGSRSTSRIPAGDVFIAGLITSQIAALIMAVVMMFVFGTILGKTPLYPVQVIGSAALGEKALHGLNLEAIGAGLILHLLVALVWGIVFCVFAAWLQIETYGKAAILGILVATMSMVDAYVIVPYVMNSLWGEDIWNREVPIFWDWAAHIVLGASFVVYPVILGWLLHRQPAGHGHMAR
jgi:hypothetical protein